MPMTERLKKRPWFQIHRSTAIVLMFAGGGILWANANSSWYVLKLNLSPSDQYGSQYNKIYAYGWPYDAVWDVHDNGVKQPDGKFLYTRIETKPAYEAIAIDLLIGLLLLLAATCISEWFIRRKLAKASLPTLAMRAAQLDEIGKFLLGEAPYNLKSRRSPSDGPNDITESWDALSEVARAKPEWNIDHKIPELLRRISDNKSGMNVIAGVIICETIARRDHNSAFTFDILELAQLLRTAIRRQWHDLKTDRSGEGKQWHDGLLGMFRRLSKNIASLGGPAFFPEKGPTD